MLVSISHTADAAGGEKVVKKTKTKKKAEKKSAVKSIFDDDAPSIFDDPLNATGKWSIAV